MLSRLRLSVVLKRSKHADEDKEHAEITFELEEEQHRYDSFEARLETLFEKVNQLKKAKNPSALTFAGILGNLSSDLKKCKLDRSMIEQFEGELGATEAVIEAQVNRLITLEEEERVSFPPPVVLENRINVKFLCFQESSDGLKEFIHQNLDPNQATLRPFREEIAEFLGIKFEQVVIRYKGIILPAEKSDVPVSELLGLNSGEVIFNACDILQAIELGMIDFDDPLIEEASKEVSIISQIQTYRICVIIPGLQGDIDELILEEIEKHVDIGEIREDIANEMNLDSNNVILKFRGNFLFPFEDSKTVGEIFRDPGKTSSKIRDVQITAFEKNTAHSMGVMDDYNLQLVNYQRTGFANPDSQEHVPVGAVEIPFMRTNSPVKVNMSDLSDQEEKESVNILIEERRKQINSTTVKIIDASRKLSKEEDFAGKDSEKNTSLYIPVPPPVPAPPVLPLDTFSGNVLTLSNCRMFHWEKWNGDLSNLNGVIWKEIAAFKNLKVNVDELETFFAKRKKNVIKRNKKRSVDDVDHKSQKDPEKKEKFSLLDQKQTQRLEIMLRKIPKPSEIIQAMEKLDSSILTKEILDLIFQNIPKPDDINYVQELSCEIDERNADSSVLYVKQMSSFPFWEERLRSWRAFLDFSEHELEIKERIDLFCVSLGELMGLKSLKFVFATILIYGNEMNKGTIRGNALGFRVDSILKLSSTKATSLKGNLLDFIVRQIRDTYPEALALSTELREISSQIIRITIEMTMGGLIELSQQIKAHADSCEKLRNTISSDDPFHKVIHFFSNVDSNIADLYDLADNMIQKSKDFIAYFGMTMEDAEKIFKELYPLDSKQETKLVKVSESIWDESSITEITTTLTSAFKSRNMHNSVLFNGTDSSSDLFSDRQKHVSSAKKLLLDLVKNLSDDLEATKEISNNKNSSSSNEISLISRNVQNMIRLLLEFSDQYSDSVRRVIIPKSSKGLQNGKNRS